jgi:hypothetical protein
MVALIFFPKSRFLRKKACKHIMKFFTSPFGVRRPYAKMFSGG